MLTMILKSVALLLVLALVLVTVLPFSKSDAWWIRGWDFPRVHIAALSALAIVLVTASWGLTRPAGLTLAAAALAITVYQGLKVLPYTPLWPKELHLAARGDNDITLLASNVLLENPTPEKIADHVRAADADIVLLMETDTGWYETLKASLTQYPLIEAMPKEGHYGMIFATRLEVVQAEFRFLSDDDTPAMIATLRSPDGEVFTFVGLHPRPPVPGDDAEARDEQIRTAARVAHHLEHPVIAMGDFNDVAWSATSIAFKRHGGYRDPRIGRGIFPSFDARSWWMKFPIDQLFVTEGVEVVAFGRGPYVGSDHYPMHATVRISGTAD